MTRKLLILSAGLWAASASMLPAQSADSIINRYIEASGGMAKIQAIQSLRRTGKYSGGAATGWPGSWPFRRRPRCSG